MNQAKITANIAALAAVVLLIMAAIYYGGWQQADSGIQAARPGASPWASAWQEREHAPILVQGAQLYVGDGTAMESADVLVRDGRIVQVAEGIERPDDDDLVVVDGRGKWLTPGLIDVHSHLGVYPAPSIAATSDGNEATSPATPEVWAEHSVFTQDPQFQLALAGGVTTMQILPGSANLFGGRGVVVRNRPALEVTAMKFPGAPHPLKMACGENPKRVYSDSGPATRMANFAHYRAKWIEAHNYKHELQKAGGTLPQKDRDLGMETLVGVLDDEILVNNHCYRAEEMLQMMRLGDEFGYKTTTFHHAVEAYKIANELADRGVCAALWADWWGFKLEAWDLSRANIAIVDQARGGKGCAIVHSDSELGIQRLNQEAAKALAAGQRLGMDISRARAIMWITHNPAKSMRIEDQVGRLAPGLRADMVLWSHDPLDSRALAERVWIDGSQVFDRAARPPATPSDFSLGAVK